MCRTAVPWRWKPLLEGGQSKAWMSFWDIHLAKALFPLSPANSVWTAVVTRAIAGATYVQWTGQASGGYEDFRLVYQTPAGGA